MAVEMADELQLTRHYCRRLNQNCFHLKHYDRVSTCHTK